MGKVAIAIADREGLLVFDGIWRRQLYGQIESFALKLIQQECYAFRVNFDLDDGYFHKGFLFQLLKKNRASLAP